MKLQHSAGIVLFHKGPEGLRYLVLQYVGGHWDFAKGKIEAGETMKEAALRELHEETGLTAQIADGYEQSLSYMFKDQQGNLIHKRVTFFVGESPKTEVILSREHQGYLWLPYEQARERVTFENAREVLKTAHAFIKKERLL